MPSNDAINSCPSSNPSAKQVVLSGGTFINRILLKKVKQGLEGKRRGVYINEKVPCGDGGIALGQMYLATFQNDLMLK